jgi:hypothetical protein
MFSIFTSLFMVTFVSMVTLVTFSTTLFLVSLV